jgi:hypothetical protein
MAFDNSAVWLVDLSPDNNAWAAPAISVGSGTGSPDGDAPKQSTAFEVFVLIHRVEFRTSYSRVPLGIGIAMRAISPAQHNDTRILRIQG